VRALAKIIAATSLLSGCAHTTYLPHRDPVELFPQANSPPAECPGQYKMTVGLPDADGRFFIYCFGKMVTL
jgi:hypothetical protein